MRKKKVPVWVLGGMCEMCGEVPAWCVDHDHETGYIRGNLCRSCNWLAIHPDKLRRALAWVETPRPGLPLYKDYRSDPAGKRGWAAKSEDPEYRERNRERSLDYYEEHPEEIKARAAKWNKDNPDRRRVIALDSYHRNKGDAGPHEPTGIVAADMREYKREYMRRARAVRREAEGLPPALHNREKTSCKNGHPFDEENTIMRQGGGRACKLCARASAATYREARKKRHQDTA